MFFFSSIHFLLKNFSRNLQIDNYLNLFISVEYYEIFGNSNLE